MSLHQTKNKRLSRHNIIDFAHSDFRFQQDRKSAVGWAVKWRHAQCCWEASISYQSKHNALEAYGGREYTVGQKNTTSNSCSYRCQMLTDLQNSFTDTLRRKFAIPYRGHCKSNRTSKTLLHYLVKYQLSKMAPIKNTTWADITR